MTFRVGQKVTCVKRGKWRQADYSELPSAEVGPVFGDIVTIRNMVIAEDGELYLRFFEFRNPPIRIPAPDGSKECAFLALHFRPLIERKTDSGVAILKKIARDVTERKTVKITERA